MLARRRAQVIDGWRLHTPHHPPYRDLWSPTLAFWAALAGSVGFAGVILELIGRS